MFALIFDFYFFTVLLLTFESGNLEINSDIL